MNSERTNKVLEKWGGDEMNENEIQKAAEMFAKIKVKNRFLKKVAILGVVFMVVFIGLMLGSVILGAEVSKDFKVKNEALVQKSGNVVQTLEMFYSVKLNLLTPLSVIKGLKSLKFKNKNDGSTLQFNVVSFYYIYGRNLTIYGHTQMANVLGNGDVEFYPISNVNGVKRIDESKVIKKTNDDDDDDLQAMSNNGNGNGNGVTHISDCTDLSNIGSTGKYSLMNNINCNLADPLLPNGFSGTFNGRGHTITLNMNKNGPVALFAKVLSSAKFANLFIDGTIVGKGNCSALSIEAYSGAKFLSCAVYANITCSNINDDLGDFTSLGGFAAVLRNPTDDNQKISFKYSVNQGYFNSYSSISNKISYTGGFYGRMGYNEFMKRRFNFTYSATTFVRYGNESHVNRFGYKFVFSNPIPPTSPPARSELENTNAHEIQKRTYTPYPNGDPYIPEDCYNFDDTNEDFINMCIYFYTLNYYENYDCCSDFNSCPYVNCNLYEQACYFCQIHKRTEDNSNNNNGGASLLKIVPTVQKICDFDE